MPKTLPPKTITKEEFRSDPTKWVRESSKGVVKVIDENGNPGMTLSTVYGHTDRVKHKYSTWDLDEQALSDLRDYYCSIFDGSETMRLLIELIEKYADSQLWNLDDYSDMNDRRIDEGE